MEMGPGVDAIRAVIERCKWDRRRIRRGARIGMVALRAAVWLAGSFGARVDARAGRLCNETG